MSVCRPVVLWYKVCKFFWCHACMKCAPPFFSKKAFHPLVVTYLHTVGLKTLILWSWSSLFTLQSCWIITHILTAFSITFFTQFVKKTSHLLLGLFCKVFTFDHLFSHRSNFFKNLIISLTKWTEYRKNRCLSSGTNSVRLHFRERGKKTKENAKKTKIENLQNGQEKKRREKIGVRGHLGKIFKKYHNFFKF